MSTLRVNLKHLYQRWTAVVFFGLFGGLCLFALVASTATGHRGTLPFVALVLYCLSLFVATFPVDVLTKPFSYCLPGHRRVPARWLLVVGLGLCLLALLPEFLRPETRSGDGLLGLIPRFAVYLLCFWLGVATVFRFRSWGTGFCLFPLGMWALQDSELSLRIESWVLTHAALVVLLGAAVTVCAYRLLADPGLARRYCARLWFGLFDPWNRDKVARFRKERLAEKLDRRATDASAAWDRAWLGCPGAAAPGGLGRHVRFGLYPLVTANWVRRRNWLGAVAVWLPLIVFLGYTGPGVNVIFVLPTAMVAYVPLGEQSTLLIAGGRRERFYAALSRSLAITVLIVAGLALLTGAAHLVAPHLPELTVRGAALRFHRPNVILILVTLFLVPLAWAASLIFPRQAIWSRLIPLVLFVLAFTLMGVAEHAGPSILVGAVAVGLCLLTAWAAFVGVLRYTCMRRCLGSV